jgi:hypothetical protein
LNEQTTQRAHLMAALAAVQEIVQNTPVVPSNLTIVRPPFEQGAYSVEVNFHHRPESFADFAADLGLEASYRGEHCGRPRPYLEASGEAYGVVVRVWDLGDDGEQERYAAAVPSLGLPSAWRVAGAS